MLPVLAPAALLLAAAALPAAWLPVSGGADEEEDHERARAALRAGRVLPLEDIVARAETATGGTVLDVEIEDGDEDDHGPRHHDRRGHAAAAEGAAERLVYEVKMLVPGGRIVKLIYDA
ncbi:PepSY domain-containing protein, partial [Azospirillum sp. ST 5-10]